MLCRRPANLFARLTCIWTRYECDTSILWTLLNSPSSCRSTERSLTSTSRKCVQCHCPTSISTAALSVANTFKAEARVPTRTLMQYTTTTMSSSILNWPRFVSSISTREVSLTALRCTCYQTDTLSRIHL